MDTHLNNPLSINEPLIINHYPYVIIVIPLNINDPLSIFMTINNSK